MKQILNSKGEPIVLNAREKLHADELQGQVTSFLNKMGVPKSVRNTVGYDISITTLTTIMKKVSGQKFFEIAPADYLPIRVGEGAWSSNLVTYRSFDFADDFTTGNLNTGGNNSRLANADTGVDSLMIPVINWAKTINWSIIDLEQAARSGNWDLVTSKERARKRNWDLGIQKTAFLGQPSVTGTNAIYGLLNQPTVNINTTLLTNSIGSLAGSNGVALSSFLGALLNQYRINCNRSAWPTHFIIPESDYLALAIPSSPQFPLKSILQLMQETLQTMTGNKNFKILPCSYADSAYSGVPNQVYTLSNYAEESVRMDIPVDYTNTLANSINNFQFQNVGYGQYTGVLAYRQLEMLYFQFPASNLGTPPL